MTMRNLTTSTLAMILLATAAASGCAADAVGPDDDIDTGSGSNNPDGSNTPPPTTPEGKYSMQSDIDVASNMPGTAGTIVNYFISATDDPDDPTKFIVEQVVAALPDGSIKNTLNGSIPFVAGYLNDRLLEVAPDFVSNIVDVGDKFGQMAHHFGTVETLEVNAQGQATKTITGLHFTIDGVDENFAFADEGIANVVVPNVLVTLDQNGKLTIGEHTVGLKFGSVVKLAMDKAIIPMIDPSASNLGDLMKKWVNCQAVGQYVYEAVGIGSASTFQSACTAGLTGGSNALYKLLDNIDTSALQFNMTGTARAIDKNHDGKIDDIQTGTWTGSTAYAGATSTMGAAKFFGSKM
jgi:hypothetical protein